MATAPASISSGWTPGAKALSFHFFLTDLTFTSWIPLEERTRTAATIRPVRSSMVQAVCFQQFSYESQTRFIPERGKVNLMGEYCIDITSPISISGLW